jgi:hypothetical protein
MDDRVPETRATGSTLTMKLYELQKDNETTLKESYPSGFVLFMPYGDGFIHLPHSHLPHSNRSSAMARLCPDWGLSTYEYLGKNQAKVVFKGWEHEIRGEISGDAHIVHLVDTDAIEATFPLELGLEVGLFEWRNRRGVYLKVIDARQRYPVFAMGIRELPSNRTKAN